MGFGLKADVSSGRRLAVLGVLRMEWRPGEGEAGRQLGERTPGVEVLLRLPECVLEGGGTAEEVSGRLGLDGPGSPIGKRGAMGVCARA